MREASGGRAGKEERRKSECLPSGRHERTELVQAAVKLQVRRQCVGGRFRKEQGQPGMKLQI